MNYMTASHLNILHCKNQDPTQRTHIKPTVKILYINTHVNNLNLTKARPTMAYTTNLLRSLLLVTLLSSLLVRPSESTIVQRRSAKETSAVFIGECLYNHNALRASLNLPPLQWSTELANYARWWLNQLRATCDMVHSNSNYGENLFWGQGDGWTAAEAVEAWAAERAYFNYGSNTCMPNMDCTHYTQMVWRTTTTVGCAMIKCLDGDTLMACDYAPHGNTIGEWPY